jgi:hypothetical protein
VKPFKWFLLIAAIAVGVTIIIVAVRQSKKNDLSDGQTPVKKTGGASGASGASGTAGAADEQPLELLSVGSDGPAVMALQTSLNVLLALAQAKSVANAPPKLKADGDFGNLTKGALIFLTGLPSYRAVDAAQLALEATSYSTPPASTSTVTGAQWLAALKARAAGLAQGAPAPGAPGIPSTPASGGLPAGVVKLTGPQGDVFIYGNHPNAFVSRNPQGPWTRPLRFGLSYANAQVSFYF